MNPKLEELNKKLAFLSSQTDVKKKRQILAKTKRAIANGHFFYKSDLAYYGLKVLPGALPLKLNKFEAYHTEQLDHSNVNSRIIEVDMPGPEVGIPIDYREQEDRDYYDLAAVNRI